MLDKWVEEVCSELGVADDVDIKELLDVARVAAHKVERRAAPITTYVMGVAVASGEGSIKDVSRRVVSLARRWEGDPEEGERRQ